MEGPNARGVLRVPRQGMDWQLLFAAAFIIEPSKGIAAAEAERRVKGSAVDVESLPKEFFIPLFQETAADFPIEIAFKPAEGRQENEVRSLIREILFGRSKTSEKAAGKLAARLAVSSDQRSPEGL